MNSTHDTVREYYGTTLAGSDDLQTNACCDQTIPDWLKSVSRLLHEEVVSHYYGCGLVAPSLLKGTRILDLGCGSGRDCYVLAWLAGEGGRVIGVDMTSEQLAIARRHEDYHRQQFGFQNSNVSFLEGYIEQLDQLDLADDSFDIVVSNCVINLSPDKEKVLREVFRVLKPGGEFYFSDIYADRRLPDELRQDPVLYGECLAGALYWNDFLDLARSCGFTDPRLVEDRPITINNDQVAMKIAPARFYSATFRLFKLNGLEPACEDYGQAVIYQGTIDDQPDSFRLDNHHHIDQGRVFPVCGNTFRMLNESRYAPHFECIGDFSRHYGIFPGCGINMPFSDDDQSARSGCC